MKTHGTLQYRGGHRPGAGQFLLTASPHVMTKAKRLFPRGEPSRAGALLLSDTPEVSRDLEWFVDRYPVTFEGAAAAALEERATLHREREVTIERILSGERLSLDLREPECELREYQVLAADLILQTGRLLVVDDAGLGKTITSLLVLRDPKALPAVVACLTHLPVQWFREAKKALPWLYVHIVDRMEPYDPATRRGVLRRPDLLIVPYSKLRGWGDYLHGEARTAIFDEAQELRTGPGSMKYWAAERIADGADYRVGLTASPVYNYGGELWNVLNVIAPDVLGTYSEFSREWCSGDRHEAVTVPAGGFPSPSTSNFGPAAAPAPAPEPAYQPSSSGKLRVADPAALSLYLREEGVFLRRTRKDVGRELPPAIRVPHVVDCDADLLDRLSGEVVALADLILARETKRTDRFLAAGELDWKMRRQTGLAKAPYVADFTKLLLETEPKVVLYGWHRDVYDEWRVRLADFEPAWYTGTESPKKKQESVDRFTEGDTRLLIISLRAGAGLDGLQKVCKTAVFGELDWSPGIHDQCIWRLQRDGMGDEPVLAYFLHTEDGSDPIVMEVLNLKRQQSEPILDPHAAPLATPVETMNRVRLLAQDVVERYRRR